MGTLFLVSRATVATVIVIIFLQIRTGDQTLEQRSENFIRQSTMIGHLQQVADGALVVLQKLMGQVGQVFETKVSKTIDTSNLPGNRLNIDISRSREFLREQAARAKKAVDATVGKHVQEQVDTLQNSENIDDE